MQLYFPREELTDEESQPCLPWFSFLTHLGRGVAAEHEEYKKRDESDPLPEASAELEAVPCCI